MWKASFIYKITRRTCSDSWQLFMDGHQEGKSVTQLKVSGITWRCRGLWMEPIQQYEQTLKLKHFCWRDKQLQEAFGRGCWCNLEICKVLFVVTLVRLCLIIIAMTRPHFRSNQCKNPDLSKGLQTSSCKNTAQFKLNTIVKQSSKKDYIVFNYIIII